MPFSDGPLPHPRQGPDFIGADKGPTDFFSSLSGQEEPVKDGLVWDVFSTPRGWMGALASSRGLRRLTLPQPSAEGARRELALQEAEAEHQPLRFASLQERLEAYFRGQPMTFRTPLDLEGTPPFFRQAWQACQAIPPGETRSYAWLASQAGRPWAARAAGQAMARNPLPILIPCHRVVGSDGRLGGYGGGLDMKRELLRLETQQGVPRTHTRACPGPTFR